MTQNLKENHNDIDGEMLKDNKVAILDNEIEYCRNYQNDQTVVICINDFIYNVHIIWVTFFDFVF